MPHRHPDSLCMKCDDYAGGACPHFQRTLNERGRQPLPVTACSHYDALKAGTIVLQHVEVVPAGEEPVTALPRVRRPKTAVQRRTAKAVKQAPVPPPVIPAAPATPTDEQADAAAAATLPTGS